MAAKKRMTKLVECDNVAILPWYDSDMGENRIKQVSDTPSSLFMFEKYFQRANPKEKGEKIYTDIYLTHTKRIEIILEDLSWFLKKEKIDIFVKDLQADTIARLRWLPFSFQSIHVKSLCQELLTLVGIEIAGRYKPVLIDVRDPSIDNKKIPQRCTP